MAFAQGDPADIGAKAFADGCGEKVAEEMAKQEAQAKAVADALNAAAKGLTELSKDLLKGGSAREMMNAVAKAGRAGATWGARTGGRALGRYAGGLIASVPWYLAEQSVKSLSESFIFKDEKEECAFRITILTRQIDSILKLKQEIESHLNDQGLAEEDRKTLRANAAELQTWMNRNTKNSLDLANHQVFLNDELSLERSARRLFIKIFWIQFGPPPGPPARVADLKPILDDAAAFGVGDFDVPVQLDAQTIVIRGPGLDFGEAQDVVLVVRDEPLAPPTAGETPVAHEPAEKDPTTLRIPVDAINAGLKGILVRSKTPDANGVTPVHYVQLKPVDKASTPINTGPTIQAIRGVGGAAPTLHSLFGRTATLAVDGRELGAGHITVGKKSTDSETPKPIAAFTSDLSVIQKDRNDKTLLESSFGRFEGSDLGKLSADEAVVGLTDPKTGGWLEGTVRPLKDVMPEAASATGLFTPGVQVTPPVLKVNQMHKDTATMKGGEAELVQIADAAGVSPATARQLGVTELFVDGKLVGSKRWSEGFEVAHEGTARKGETLIKVSAKYKFSGPDTFKAWAEKYAAEKRGDIEARRNTIISDSIAATLLKNAEVVQARAMKLAGE